ncbi:hypothetical protein [Nonomuraea sp. NPDC023979]|uniref:hypothetical protein n=1 Tax=Nonomuraea sp. NPDC023979 TaxID=3154796 RepID=UPI0033EBE6E6
MSWLSRHREAQAACARLAPKFGDAATKSMAKRFEGYAMLSIEAVTAVAGGLRKPDHEDYMATPTPADVDDALLVVRGVREQLLVDELALIERARANGRSWERIAELLDVSEAVAKARPAKLRRAIDDLNRI